MATEVRGIVAASAKSPVQMETVTVPEPGPGEARVTIQGRLDLDRFVAETISIDDVEAAFERMQRGEVLRSVVVMD